MAPPLALVLVLESTKLESRILTLPLSANTAPPEPARASTGDVPHVPHATLPLKLLAAMPPGPSNPGPDKSPPEAVPQAPCPPWRRYAHLTMPRPDPTRTLVRVPTGAAPR